MKPRFLFGLLLLAILTACSSSSQSTVSGTVYAPNGVDPVPGADVYVPAAWGAALAAVPLSADGADLFGDTATALVKTVTDPQGNFVLTGVPQGAVPLVLSSGLFKRRIDLAGGEGRGGRLAAALTTLPGCPTSITERAARIAVVTGDWDQMEDLLAKFGMGQTDPVGALVPGSESFQVYLACGYHTISETEPGGDWPYLWGVPWPDSYPGVGVLFADLATMRQYDIIVINCGDTARENVQPLIDDPAVRARIHDFVQQGGRLYVTDRSYDWFEQVFPEYIRFQNGDDGTPFTPEAQNAAEVGYSGYWDDLLIQWVDFTTAGTVLDGDLSAWLAGMDSLDPDGTVHLESFWGGWSVMAGPHTGAAGDQCKVWIEGPVRWYPDASNWDDATLVSGVRPLTVSFPYGTGKVLYTSYHTDGDPHPGFTPQERVLEYLLFESAR